MEAKVKKAEIKQTKIGSIALLPFLFFVTLTTTVFGQKIVLNISTDKKEIAPEERITLTVTSNVQGSINIEYPNEFEVDMGIMHGMEQKMDGSGRIISVYYVQQSGIFKKEGIYSLSASMVHKNKTIHSNKISITVAEPSNTEISEIRSNDPIFGLIQSQKTSVYEGEPLVVQAKVFSFLDINYLEAYIPFKSSTSIEKHDFPNKKVTLEQTRINGKNALTFEYGKQVLFPIATGKSTIKPFEMALRCSGALCAKTYRIRSAGLTIDVKPLPNGAPTSFIGAVGVYQLHQKTPASDIKEGDVVTLELIISGAGNMHNSNAPKLKLPKGCSIYGDPERVENFTFTENGAEGSITYRYNIQVNTGGEVNFPATEVAYFDPAKEKYIVLKGNAFTLSAKESANMIVNRKVEKSTDTEQPLNTEAGTKVSNSSPAKLSPWIIGVAAPTGLLGLLFVLFLIQKKRKKNSASDIKHSSKCKSLGTEEIQLHQETTQPLIIKQDYWQEAISQQSNSTVFANIFPKAILQRVECILSSSFNNRDAMYAAINNTCPECARYLKEIVDTCDRYRYDFGSTDIDCHKMMQEVSSILDKIHSK